MWLKFQVKQAKLQSKMFETEIEPSNTNLVHEDDIKKNVCFYCGKRFIYRHPSASTILVAGEKPC